MKEDLPLTPFRTIDVTVAETIMEQLGGNRFLAMTGARLLLAHTWGLTLQLPSNFANHGINRVRIELNSQDLYDVTFSRARGLRLSYESKAEGIDCEQLAMVFSETTGLQLSL